MKYPLPTVLRLVVLLLALVMPARPVLGRSLSIGGNTAVSGYDPVTGVVYLELRSTLTTEFPGTTFTSLPSLAVNLSGFDLLVLNRFDSPDLMPSEQAAILSYVRNGGNLLYVGEATAGTVGSISNDTFTVPFGISMTPDPATNISLAFGTYTNTDHPCLNGPFGAPPDSPSGSSAAQVTRLGLSVELARWNGGGVSISALSRNALVQGSGFGLFATDINMMTPNRYATEFGSVLANALVLPEPGSVIELLFGLAGIVGTRRFGRAVAFTACACG